MDSSLELLSFLTRSQNRVATLDGLTTASKTRSELQAETGIPRATLSRILRDFEDRDLVTRTAGEYATTRLGDCLAAALGSACDSIDRTQRLQAVTQWIALDDVEFEFDDLVDARVTFPSQADPLAPMKRAATVLEDVERVQALCPSVVHEPLVTEWRAIIERGQRFEGVVTPDVLAVVACDPAMRERVQSVAGAENASLVVHDGPVPHFLILAGPTVLLVAADDDGAIHGIVETDDEAVHGWATSTFEAYQVSAESVDPGALTT